MTIKIKSIVSALLAAAALPLFGKSYSYNSMTWTDDPASPGKWTSKYADAKAYAKKNKVPMVVVWANAGCTYCQKLENALGSQTAQKWAAEQGYVFVFALNGDGNYGLSASDNQAALDFASNNGGLTKYPFVGIWWPKKSGGEVKQRFSGRDGMMPVTTGTLSKQFMDSVDFYVGAYASTKPKTCTVSFNANGGTNPSETMRFVAQGKAVGSLPTTTKAGYKLTGWATAKTGGTVITKSTKVMSDVTYYAQWKKVVTLTLKDSPEGEGKLIGAGQYDEGAKVAVKTAPKKGGIFSCWKKGSEIVSQIPKFNYTLGSADVTLTAYFITKTEDENSIALRVNNKAITSDDGAETLKQGVAVSWPVVASAKTATTPTVTGLPSGLKLVKDKETGKYSITGAPTAVSKTDKYGNVKPSVVTFKVKTSGGNAKTYKMAITVEERPAYTVGVFNGGVYNPPDTSHPVGQIYSLNIAANGKVSGKLLRDGKTYTLSASSLDSDSPYKVTVTGKSGKETITKVFKIVKMSFGGYVTATDNSAVAYSTPWKTNEKLKALAKKIAKAKPLTLSNGVVLKFGSAGVVTVKYGSYSGTTVLIPFSETPDYFSLYLYIAPKNGKFEGYVDHVVVYWDDGEFHTGE